MKESAHNAYRMVPMILVMGIIFFLSHQTGDEITLPDFSNSDLVAHMIAYAVLGGTVLYAWSKPVKRRNPSKVVLNTVFFCLLYGISDEFHQSFIPGRYVSAMDVVADTLGGLLVCTCWLLYRRKSLAYKTSS